MQGGWEADETAQEAATREAMEEAGIRGDLLVRYLTYLSLKRLDLIQMKM